MKKLLLILLLFSASTFAQKITKIPGQIPGDDNYKTGAVILMLNPDSTFSAINDSTRLPVNIGGATINATITDVGIKGSSSLGNNTLTVGTTAVQVSSTSTACRWVSVMNNTPGTTVYVGGSSVTSSNGYAALNYKDAVRVEIDNLTKLYLISTQASTDVRYLYAN